EPLGDPRVVVGHEPTFRPVAARLINEHPRRGRLEPLVTLRGRIDENSWEPLEPVARAYAAARDVPQVLAETLGERDRELLLDLLHDVFLERRKAMVIVGARSETATLRIAGFERGEACDPFRRVHCRSVLSDQLTTFSSSASSPVAISCRVFLQAR